jgi:hypothetical protein
MSKGTRLPQPGAKGFTLQLGKVLMHRLRKRHGEALDRRMATVMGAAMAVMLEGDPAQIDLTEPPRE